MNLQTLINYLKKPFIEMMNTYREGVYLRKAAENIDKQIEQDKKDHELFNTDYNPVIQFHRKEKS